MNITPTADYIAGWKYHANFFNKLQYRIFSQSARLASPWKKVYELRRYL
jgi:hypothetical protein